MSLVKVQRWLSTRRSRRPKVKKHGRATEQDESTNELTVPQIVRSSSVGSRPSSVSIAGSSSSHTIQVQELQTSPGERRRSNATFLSSQSSLQSTSTMSSQRPRANTTGAGDSGITRMLLKLSPSMRKRREAKRSPRSSPNSTLDRRNRQDDNMSTVSEVWKVSEVRGCVALLSGGEQLKLPESVLEGDMKKEGFLQKHGRRFGGWKRRWLVLDTGEVAMFKTDSLIGFSGIIAMDQVVCINYPSSVASFGFTFEVVTTKRSYVLAAKTEEEAIHWVHLLRRASHTDKPRTGMKGRPSRFFVRRDTEIGEPRTDNELRSGLFRSEAAEDTNVSTLKEHVESLDESELSSSSSSLKLPDKPCGAEPVNMAAEGLAIDALQAFLSCN